MSAIQLNMEVDFLSLGSGITACERTNSTNNEYIKLAHINEWREITYLKPISGHIRARVEEFATNSNSPFLRPRRVCAKAAKIAQFLSVDSSGVLQWCHLEIRKLNSDFRVSANTAIAPIALACLLCMEKGIALDALNINHVMLTHNWGSLI